MQIDSSPQAGKGYLRLDRNLFMYDPTTGKWEDVDLIQDFVLENGLIDWCVSVAV